MGSPNNPFASGDANPFGAPGANPYQQPGANPYAPAGGDPYAPTSVNPFGAPGGQPGATPSPQGSSLAVTGPPTGLLAGAAVVALLGVAVALIGWGGWLTVVGWAIAGPLAIGVMALYLSTDTTRRAAAVYVRPDWVRVAYAGVAALFVIAVLVTAVAVAFWLGRL